MKTYVLNLRKSKFLLNLNHAQAKSFKSYYLAPVYFIPLAMSVYC